MSNTRIAALLTRHNRRDKTTACLKSLRDQAGLAELGVSLQVFLVDDGCTDGTATAALEIWPEAEIIKGDGHRYWCGGMRKASYLPLCGGRTFANRLMGFFDLAPSLPFPNLPLHWGELSKGLASICRSLLAARSLT